MLPQVAMIDANDRIGADTDSSPVREHLKPGSIGVMLHSLCFRRGPGAMRIQRRLSMIEFRFLIAAAAVGMGVLITDPAIGTATPLTPISSAAITTITERSGGI